MNYFIIPLSIFIAVMALSIWTMTKFRIGKIFIKSVAAMLCVPVFYLLLEASLFYSLGRTIIPTVGIVIGMFCPPGTYDQHLSEMEIFNGVTNYEGEFSCRHLGKYGIALCVDRSKLKSHQQMATLRYGLSYEIVTPEGHVCTSGSVDPQYGSYVNMYSPYVVIGKFNVPDDVIRNKKYRIKVVLKGKGHDILKGVPCDFITVIKVSDV